VEKKGFIINKDYDPLILQTIVKRYWWWPVLFVAFFVTMSYFYLRYTKPTYESTMVIQIDNEDNARDVIDIENINSKQNDISSEVELMRSQLMFEKAIQRINYNVSLYSKGQVLIEEKYNSSTFNVLPFALKDSMLIGVPIYVDFDGEIVTLSYTHNGKKNVINGKLDAHFENTHFDLVVKSSNVNELLTDANQNELYFTFNSVQSFASRYLPNLQVVPIDPIAKTIQVTFRGNNPQLCHDLTLAIAEAFVNYDEENKRKGSENVLHFIDQQLDSLSGELKNSKDSLMIYQRKSNIPDPLTAGDDISSNISKFQDQLFILEDEIRSLNQVNSKLKNEPNRLEVYRLLPEMLGKSYEQSLSTQISSLYDLLEKKEDLLFQVTDENAEIKVLNGRIQTKLGSIRKSISTILERLYANSKTIRDKITGYESEFFELPEKKMEFSRLKNIQDLNEKYFTLLTEKKVLYAISDAGYSSNSRILTRPMVNGIPVSPNRKLIYVTFIMFGFTLGLGIMFIKYLTFNEINLIEDLDKLLPTRASILGGVPLYNSGMEFSQLVVGDAPKSMLSESMRKIRTNLSYIHRDYKTIAVTSSISGEGKTFVSLNLAGIIAMSGKKTILLDLDLRKPKIHLGLGVSNDAGMSSLISEQYELKDCIKASKIGNLFFITAGPIPPNPSELLLSDRFKDIIEELKTQFDVIIMDNPPIGLVSDGIKILTDADIPIYVFKSHYSKRIFAHRVKELFDMNQLTKLNVILNGIKANGRSNYGYGYGYGYGNGYYEESEKNRISLKQRFLKLLKRK
jgi:capsular exopolysaccharide synthesis family protein